MYTLKSDNIFAETTDGIGRMATQITLSLTSAYTANYQNSLGPTFWFSVLFQSKYELQNNVT